MTEDFDIPNKKIRKQSHIERRKRYEINIKKLINFANEIKNPEVNPEPLREEEIQDRQQIDRED